MYKMTKIEVSWYAEDITITSKKSIFNIWLLTGGNILHKWQYRNAKVMLTSIFYYIFLDVTCREVLKDVKNV